MSIVVVASACTDNASGGGGARRSDPVVSAPGPTSSVAPASTRTVPGPTPARATVPTDPTPTDPALTSTAPESGAIPVTDPPQTGVPGTGADEYCTAVGTIVLSEYLVGLVEAFGDPVGARRAEATAAPTVLDAVARATEAQPASDAITAQFSARWQPFVARATTALGSFGSDTGELELEWARVLANHDRNDPVLVVAPGPRVSAALDVAAAALDAAHGPLVADAAHLAAVSTPSPELDALLAVRCPDVAAMAAGDAV